jgi:hypothetical protein
MGNTLRPCDECKHLYADCMQEDNPDYHAECKHGWSMGNPNCPWFKHWEEKKPMITADYLSSFEKDYWAGKYKGQRFGQAFINSLSEGQRSTIDNPDLDNEIFYSNDPFWVKRLLWTHVIRQEVPEVHSQED